MDPNQQIQLTSGLASVHEALYQIADQTNMAVVRMGDVFYFGPPREVAELIWIRRSLIDESRKLPEKNRRILLQRKDISWDRLAQPGRILQRQLMDADLSADDIAAVGG